MTERSAVRRALKRAAQIVLGTPVGAPFGRLLYTAAARTAALSLSRVPGVDSVYAAGSLASPRALRPGFSDIDLMLLVSTPTAGDELALRERLHGAQRGLNRMGALFGSIDYIESRDVDLFRRHGDAWWSEMDRRCKHLAGRDILDPAFRAPERHLRLQHLAGNLRRWFKASSFVLELSSERGRVAADRARARFLADFVSTLVVAGRHDPLPDLLRRVRGDVGVALAALKGAAETDTLSPDPVVFASAALEALEHDAARVTRAWSHEATVGRERAPDGEAARLLPLALEHGFASVCVAERAPGDHVLLVVSRPGERSTDVMARHRALLGRVQPLPSDRFPWVQRPIVVTPALFAAAWLFEPSLGGASRIVEVHGAPLPALGVPPPHEQALLARTFRLSRATRARGRRFRAHSSDEAVERATATELRRLTGDRSLGGSERELLESVRQALERERKTPEELRTTSRG